MLHLGGSGWQRQGGREIFSFILFCTFLNFEPCECIAYSKEKKFTIFTYYLEQSNLIKI